MNGRDAAPSSGWIDISLPLGPDSVAWTGIEPPRLRRVADIDGGDSVNVGVWTACLHTATHADAPSHVRSDGLTIERVGLGAYLGPARLVRLGPAGAIDVPGLIAAGLDPHGRWPERILVATGRPYDGVHWPERVPHLDVDAAAECVARGVRLLGVDVPSVDPLDSRELSAHHALFDGGVAILENLRLVDLVPGAYWLAAVPLCIVGGDASPVRAVVRKVADGA